MKHTSGKIILIVQLAVILGSPMALAASADGDVSIKVTVDRDTIGLDEYATLQVVISGPSQNLPNPMMPTLPAFEVYSQGRSSNISIVNGQVSSSVTYRYLLMPSKAGTFPIRNIALVYSNKRYVGDPVEVTVLNKGTATPPRLEQRAADSTGHGKDLFMEAVVDNKNPYVNEQVTLSLKFYIAVQHYGSPELTEPSTTGFWTELLGNMAPYRQTINNRTYKVIERRYALFPTQTGDLTIGRATIRITVASRDRRRRDPFGLFGDFFNSGREVAVSSRPLRINVKPLPEEGRSADFTGSIGKYKLSSSVDKREVEVNQPITVTIRISGTGNIKAAAEPVIPEQEGFRIYRASSRENITKIKDKIGGTKVYEEVFMPKRPGALEIPAFTYSFFDPDLERYETVSTQPVAVRVTKPEGYMAGEDVPYLRPELTIGSEARRIRYIKDDLGELVPVGRLLLTTPLYLVANGLPVVILAGVVLVRRRRQKLAADVSYARARKAGKLAKKRLAKARSLAAEGNSEEFFAEVHFTLTAYVADKLNMSPHGLTTDQLRDLLLDRDAEPTLVNDIIAVLGKCDFARFAPASMEPGDYAEALQAAEQIMVRLEDVRFA